MRAIVFAIAVSAFAAPALADPGLAHIGGASYGEARITASTARYWNNCTAGIEVGAALVAHDCGRIIGARLSRTRTASAYYLRGRAYREVGRTADAQADFQSACTTFEHILKDNADDPMAIYGRGVSLIGLGRSSEGETEINRATAIDANVAAAFARRVTF